MNGITQQGYCRQCGHWQGLDANAQCARCLEAWYATFCQARATESRYSRRVYGGTS